MTAHAQNRGIVRTLIDNSFLLVAGAVIALVWANVDTQSYNSLIHFDVTSLWNDHSTEGGGEAEHASAQAAHGEAAHGESDGSHEPAHGTGEES